MLDWEDLRHLLALSQTGTLSGAARMLAVEHATVSRRVAHLERAIGARLVDRRGRRVQLTAEGERVAAIAERMSADAMTIARGGIGADQTHVGEVRISAPPAYAGAVLAPSLVRLRQRHPGIRVTVIGETRYASLGRREADIALRLSRPESGDLTVTKVGEVGFHAYAASDYAEAVDERDWTFVGYDEAMASSPQEERLAAIAAGRPIAIRASTLELQVAAVKAGGGLALLPDFIAEGQGLTRLALDGAAITRDLWLVVHTDIKDVPLGRAVTDALRAR
ncbi:LysR family transcriptional regulator [Rhizobium sp. S152]|uniref:LysR family transcriptional regulator n=1 Tax=Rhizobium sp. S152 TaxID=3055038 RepID=UPI0025AA1986|nr:LysR family transcriptional regulator [Rhizobium sp. S152]MDM9628933.1 LysR family transcriptional regulator [Rhizobium sp. S152]